MGKLLVGIGNLLLGDEGVGCHVVRVVGSKVPPDVEIVDAGTCPDALWLGETIDKVVIVDAVRGGGPPGRIYRFHLGDVVEEQKSLVSLHDVSLLDCLRLAYLRHEVSEAVVIGIEPAKADWGLDLSHELQEKMPQILDVILEELNNANPKGETLC